MKRIVIAEDQPIARMDITEILTEANYDVVGTVSDGFDAIEICRKLNPDLILMDIKMPLLDGLKAAKLIIKEELAGCVVLLTAYSTKEFIEEAINIGVMGYLVKPVTEEFLLPAIEVALSNTEELKRMKKNIRQIEEKLENRKLIERAKGLLMQNEGLSEEAAYKQIRRLSVDKRLSMANIAKLIIMGGQ